MEEVLPDVLCRFDENGEDLQTLLEQSFRLFLIQGLPGRLPTGREGDSHGNTKP